MLLAVLAIFALLCHSLVIIFTPNRLLRHNGEELVRAAIASFAVDVDTLHLVARLLAFRSFRFHEIYDRLCEPPDRIELLRRFIQMTNLHGTIFSVAKLNRNLLLARSVFQAPYGASLLSSYGLKASTFLFDRATQIRVWKMAITQLGQMETTKFFHTLAKGKDGDNWTYLVEMIDPTELTPDILATMFIYERTPFLSNRIRVLRDYLITSTTEIDGFIRGLCVLYAMGKKTHDRLVPIKTLALELVHKVSPRDKNHSKKDFFNQVYNQLVTITESIRTRSLWGVLAFIVGHRFDFADADPVDLLDRVRWLLEQSAPDMMSPALSRRLLLKLKPTLQSPTVDMELPSHYLPLTCLDLDTRRDTWLRRGPFRWSSIPKKFKFPSLLKFRQRMAARIPTLYLNAVAGITVKNRVRTHSLPHLMTKLTDSQLRDALIKPYMAHFVLNALPYFILARTKGKLHKLLACDLSNWEEFFEYTLRVLGVSAREKASAWHLESYFTFAEFCSLVAISE
ncbi:hypothetical protein PSACC_00750 [Paramicrosporidium saccamoebae]|uniref:Uncharacterized protein n=1 Tax=Paramicrosporidium saccamoebae TaxID=1246581 RepID=A0A2H9TNY6_9FUNG|nr:hypothetical protein PSACC_00750 [Paramicrosporidium saccamoebae]